VEESSQSDFLLFGGSMFRFQSIANKFCWFFSLEFLWLIPFWEKSQLLKRWEDTEEFMDEQADPESQFGRIFAGLIIILAFGLLAGVLFSWAGVPKTIWFVPIFGLLLFLWGKFKEQDNYSRLIGGCSLLVGVLWGIGAFIGTRLLS